MEKSEILKKLESVYEVLDQLQETDVFQDNVKLMYYIGEAMGHVDNCGGILDDWKPEKNRRKIL